MIDFGKSDKMRKKIYIYIFNISFVNELSVCNILNQSELICLHTVKWLSSRIWLIGENKTGTTNLSQSGPGSNGNEGVFYII